MAQVVLYPPVENMTLPWEGEIYGGVKEGTVFFITGTPGENPTQHGFFVNLQEGPMTPDVNIGFHFNPRAPESICIRNSRLGPEWLAEERDARPPLDTVKWQTNSSTSSSDARKTSFAWM
ncbi:PREDICTED: galectin-6-like [Priapulus caudatus]|uniref:Galectin n=1 Tax=Priapulus caudatus TaxID=37621 RepID=A0ABM1DYN1_PRICU|nr:PREDICTED: galectin-6-like [Priapulus caudatus]